MNFKKITKEDISSIAPFLNNSLYRTCDYTLLGLYMWVDYFNYEFAIESDMLCLRENRDGKVKYLLPIARSGFPDLSVLVSQCADEEGRLTLTCVPEVFLDAIRRDYSAKESLNRDWSDYLYSARGLLTLSGKRYNKKRNLLHQFLNLYNCETERIDGGNIGEIIDFLKEGGSDMSPLAKYENEQTVSVLNNYSAFDMLHGYLFRIGGKMAGFEICECRNDVCFVHIEKADRAYKGIYQFIFWKALNEIYASAPFTYVNREEDVGDPGLRKAKMSYYPLCILNKYDVELSV